MTRSRRAHAVYLYGGYGAGAMWPEPEDALDVGDVLRWIGEATPGARIPVSVDIAEHGRPRVTICLHDGRTLVWEAQTSPERYAEQFMAWWVEQTMPPVAQSGRRAMRIGQGKEDDR